MRYSTPDQEALTASAKLNRCSEEKTERDSNQKNRNDVRINKYATIKMTTAPRVGTPGQLIAAHRRLGWIMMSSGREDVANLLLLTRSTSTDYEQLCALDVLGLAHATENDQKPYTKNSRSNSKETKLVGTKRNYLGRRIIQRCPQTM